MYKFFCFVLLLSINVFLCYSFDDDDDDSQDPACFEPINKGNCLAHHVRYAYNVELEFCVIFIYGGCGGNGNNFLTGPECVEACDALAYEAP